MTFPVDPNEVNPYAAPTPVDDELSTVVAGNAHGLLLQFRSQIHGLGGLWLCVGVLVSAFSSLFLSGQLFTLANSIFSFDDTAFGLLVLVVGGLWLIAGLMTVFKQLWAIYLGLVGSYLAFVLFAVVGITSWSVGTLVPLMYFAIAIVQSHRVIGWAKDLQRLGIPLTARA